MSFQYSHSHSDLTVKGLRNPQRHREYMNNKVNQIILRLAIITSLIYVGCSYSSVTKQMSTDKPISINTPSLELNGLLATKDLSVGTNRISFLLTSPTALVTASSADVDSIFLGEPGVVEESVIAQFFLWPLGSRGSYVTEMSFDRIGENINKVLTYADKAREDHESSDEKLEELFNALSKVGVFFEKKQ